MKYKALATVPCTLLSLSMLGLAPPSQQRPGREAPPQHEQGERAQTQGRHGLELRLDPESLRIRLQRSIARSKEMILRSEAALEKLDSGASAEEVVRELRSVDPERVKRTGSPSGSQPDEPTLDGNPQNNEAVLGFVRVELPELWKNLQPFLENEPRSAERLLGRMAPQIREILALQRAEPKLATIKTQQMHAGLNLIEAGRLYRGVIGNSAATQRERDAALDHIRAEASYRFDVELEGKQYEVDRLQARLDELRASVKLLESQRDREIEQMVNSTQRNAERLNRQQTQRPRSDDAKTSGDD